MWRSNAPRTSSRASSDGTGVGAEAVVTGTSPYCKLSTILATTVGFLGLGEAGSLIAADLARAGVDVRGWDPAVDRADGVETTDGPAAVAAGADVVVSVNSAADSFEAAESVAEALRPGQLYADFNTASPGRKREVAALIEPSGAAFADVALMQSVPGRGLRTPALASGPGAARFAELFGSHGMPVTDGGPETGLAASRKLVRSVFVKGLAAAAGESLAAAERLGCRDWLHSDIEHTLAAADLRHLVEGSRRHARRRAQEMAAAEEMLEELGIEPRVARATRQWLGELA
jgi:3-hydroxyisobutyrate dehydrogenase-like beta-hydroxyacid dehydrogenase